MQQTLDRIRGVLVIDREANEQRLERLTLAHQTALLQSYNYQRLADGIAAQIGDGLMSRAIYDQAIGELTE